MNLTDYSYITANQAESFARFTIEKRLPTILHDLISRDIYNEDIQEKIRGLLNKLPSLIVEPINLNEDESEYWTNFFHAYTKNSILEIPFFFAEIYFYRHLLDITEYVNNGIDPFQPIKEKELNDELFENLLANSNSIHDAIQIALSGNKADLSQINRYGNEIKMVLDHSSDLIRCINEQDTIHVILDNAGIELFSDFLLAHQILTHSNSKKIVFYPKILPLWVSDATMADIDNLLNYLENSKNSTINQFAEFIVEKIKSGRIEFVIHPFWNSPNHLTNFPGNLQRKIASSGVVISKGDANYRRFFEDRNIPTSFEGAASICSNQFALRTLKSEIVAGLDHEIAHGLYETDPNWMTNGKFALIQKLK